MTRDYPQSQGSPVTSPPHHSPVLSLPSPSLGAFTRALTTAYPSLHTMPLPQPVCYLLSVFVFVCTCRLLICEWMSLCVVVMVAGYFKSGVFYGSESFNAPVYFQYAPLTGSLSHLHTLSVFLLCVYVWEREWESVCLCACACAKGPNEGIVMLMSVWKAPLRFTKWVSNEGQMCWKFLFLWAQARTAQPEEMLQGLTVPLMPWLWWWNVIFFSTTF